MVTPGRQKIDDRLPNGFPVHKRVLENGLVVFVIEDHDEPIFTYQTWIKTGSRTEKMDPKISMTGLAHLFEHMMFRGTRKYGDGVYDRLLAERGAHGSNATTWFDRTNYFASLPIEHLEFIAELESDRFENLVIESALLETEKGAVVNELYMGLDDPDSVGFDLLYSNAFDKHPYRFTTIGTEDEIKSFSVEMAEYFYRTYYSPSNAFLILAGDLNPARTFASIEKFYAPMQRQNVPQVVSPLEPVQIAERRHRFQHEQIEDPKIFIGYRSPDSNHPDLPALWVLQALLTYGRGALLRSEWVDSGYASSVDGSLDRFTEAGLFSITADVQREKTGDELVEILDKVLLRIHSMDMKMGEWVTRAKSQLLTGICEEYETHSDLATFCGEWLIASGDLIKGFRIADAVRKVTPEDVARVAKIYLQPEKRTLVVGESKNRGSG